jgi:hypothetical protein
LNWRHLFAALIFLLTLPVPGQAQRLATTAFELDVPDAWRVEQHGEEMVLNVDADKSILLSPATLKEGLPPAQQEEKLEFMRKAALYAMATTAGNRNLLTVEPLKNRTRADGTRVYSTVLANQSGTHFLVQCVMVGPRSVVLIAYDGPGDPKKALNTVSQLVDNIEWR